MIVSGSVDAQDNDLDEIASQSAVGRIVAQQNRGVITPDQPGPHFRAGQSLNLTETYNGDLYASGGTVLVSGTVQGDLIVAGGTVTINGTIAEDLRVAGGTVLVNGPVNGEVTVTGGTVTFTSASRVGGSVVAFGGTLNIQGNVGGNIIGAAGTVSLDGNVGRNVTLDAGTLNIPATASISGSLSAMVGNTASVAPEARIAGGRDIQMSEAMRDGEDNQRRAGLLGALGLSFLTDFLLGSLMAIAGGSLLLYLLPRLFTQSAEAIENVPLASAGWGLAFLLLVPILFIVLLVSVVGVPLAFIILFLWIIDLIVAPWIAAYALGRLIAGRTDAEWLTNSFIQLIVGVVVLNFIGLVPVIGWLIKFIAMIMGMGALFIWKKSQIVPYEVATQTRPVEERRRDVAEPAPSSQVRARKTSRSRR